MTKISSFDVIVWTIFAGFGLSITGAIIYSFVFWVNPLEVIDKYNTYIRGWVIAMFMLASLAFILQKEGGV